MDSILRDIEVYHKKSEMAKTMIEEIMGENELLARENRVLREEKFGVEQEKEMLSFEKEELESLLNNRGQVMEKKDEVIRSFEGKFWGLQKLVEEMAERVVEKKDEGKDEELGKLKEENFGLKSEVKILEGKVKDLEEVVNLRNSLVEKFGDLENFEKKKIAEIFEFFEDVEKKISGLKEKESEESGKMEEEGREESKRMEEEMLRMKERNNTLTLRMSILEEENENQRNMLNSKQEKIRELEKILAQQKLTKKMAPIEEIEEIEPKEVKTGKKKKISFFGTSNNKFGSSARNSTAAGVKRCFDCQLKIRKKRDQIECKECETTWHRKCLPKGVKKRGFVCENCE